jgi:hypothetical protein
VDQGTYVILAGFTLSFVKAALEKLVPALLSYGHWSRSGKTQGMVVTMDI